MALDSLIDIKTLRQNLQQPNWRIIDCHFELDNPDAGRLAYQQAHIPGAIYAHLDNDLSGKIVPGKTGRHPLPEVERLVQTFSNWGIDHETQVIVYDDLGGTIAARLWWMLKWMGHAPVALLNGGLSAWIKAGYPLENVIHKPEPRTFHPVIQPSLMINAEAIETGQQPQHVLIDSRAPERYRGDIEPLDPVAGHIPGAINLHCQENLDENQVFLPKERLMERFADLVRDRTANEIIFYCGSGVTAAHNILAMYHAGLGLGKLYPGSWSDWVTDPTRPVETPSFE